MTMADSLSIAEEVANVLGQQIVEGELVIFGDCTPQEQYDSVIELISRREKMAYESGRASVCSEDSRGNRPPRKVNGMKYCRWANRNVYSCGHASC